jgi:hypothetical protein
MADDSIESGGEPVTQSGDNPAYSSIAMTDGIEVDRALRDLCAAYASRAPTPYEVALARLWLRIHRRAFRPGKWPPSRIDPTQRALIRNLDGLAGVMRAMRAATVQAFAEAAIKEAVDRGTLRLHVMLGSGRAVPLAGPDMAGVDWNRSLVTGLLWANCDPPSMWVGHSLGFAADEWRRFLDAQRRAGKKAHPNRSIDHELTERLAEKLRASQPDISIASAAASIRQVLPCNPRTGKLRDERGIRRLIAPLWTLGK